MTPSPDPHRPSAPLLELAPLQFLYLHQRDAGMLERLRLWSGWLAKGRAGDVEGELIGVDGASPKEALARAAECPWQVLIYEPAGYPVAAAPEGQP